MNTVPASERGLKLQFKLVATRKLSCNPTKQCNIRGRLTVSEPLIKEVILIQSFRPYVFMNAQLQAPRLSLSNAILCDFVQPGVVSHFALFLPSVSKYKCEQIKGFTLQKPFLIKYVGLPQLFGIFYCSF